MAVLAWIILTPQQAAAAAALNTAEAAVAPREVDNPLANALGGGLQVGSRVLPARILEAPAYEAWRVRLEMLPVMTADSDHLFLPAAET